MNVPLYVVAMVALFVFIRAFVRSTLAVWDEDAT